MHICIVTYHCNAAAFTAFLKRIILRILQLDAVLANKVTVALFAHTCKCGDNHAREGRLFALCEIASGMLVKNGCHRDEETWKSGAFV